MSEKNEAQKAIAEAKRIAEEQQRVSAAKVQEYTKIADDPKAEPVDRILAAIKASIQLQLSGQRQGSFGEQLTNIIAQATPRLEAFSGNMQQMGQDVAETRGRVERLEKNLKALLEGYGKKYEL